MQKRTILARYRFLWSLLLCMILLLSAVGVTYARYQINSSQSLQLTYGAQTDQVYISQVEEDTEEESEASAENVSEGSSDDGSDGMNPEDGVAAASLDDEEEAAEQNENTDAEATKEEYVMKFKISNGASADDYCTYDQIVALSLFATLGLEDPDDYTITLTDGEMVYNAEWFEVKEGSNLYTLYGPGWIYRFYNGAGEEASWYLPGGRLVERELSVTIVGASKMPAALSLIASAKPGEL